MIKIYYKQIWGSLYLILGIIFSVLFILGFLVLHDFYILTYLILSIGLIVMGFFRLKTPYLICNKNEILVFGLIGNVLYRYSFLNDTEISINKNRFYLNGKKMKFNVWFTNKHHWKQLYQRFSNEVKIEDELVD